MNKCNRCGREQGTSLRAGLCDYCISSDDTRDRIAAAELAKYAHPEAPYGWCPVCGEKGVMRERRPNGDDMCRGGHKYPSRDALRNQPDYTTHTSNATQPCKSCGKDNAVREFGLMCEDCQRESKFTVSGKQLTEHLIKAQEQDLKQAERLQAENERSRAAWKKDQEENQAKHREFIQEEQLRNNHLSDERARKDQLHRLYTMCLRQALGTNYMAAPTYCETALAEARRAQQYFEKETANG